MCASGGVQCAIMNDNSKVVNLPLKLKMQWLALTANIQKRNELMNRKSPLARMAVPI